MLHDGDGFTQNFLDGAQHDDEIVQIDGDQRPAVFGADQIPVLRICNWSSG